MPLAGHGTIASFTVIRVAPRGHVGQTPYAVAVVQLAEGVSLLGRVVDVPLESLRVGLPVRFRPLVVGERDHRRLRSRLSARCLFSTGRSRW